MNKQYTRELKEDEEFWRNDEFDTVEDCLADYKGNYADENPQESIFVGEVEPFDISVDGRAVIGSLEENANDECGEIAEEWEPSVGKTCSAWQDLDEELTKVVVDWLKKHNDMPSFYNVVDIREVKVDERD